MSTKLQVLIPVSVFAIIVGVVGLISIPEDKIPSIEFHDGLILLDQTQVKIHIADSNFEYMTGSMFMDKLNSNEGMFFIFDEHAIHKVWALNMQFPIDIIWFDHNNKIIHMEENVQPCKSVLENILCEKKGPNKFSKYILEVNSGFINEFDITPNSRLKIASLQN